MMHALKCGRAPDSIRAPAGCARKTLASSLFPLMFLAAAPAHADRARCAIPGTAMHWIADYCMSTLETDDEIPAGSCISEELRNAFKSDCAARRHYKNKMCALAIARGTVQGSVRRCVADPGFAGPVVRRGGVGG